MTRPSTRRLLAALSAAVVISTAGAALGVPGPANAATAPNLVTNPSLETLTNGFPACYQKSGYGANTPAYTVQTAGAHSGTTAMRLDLANYTNGDRKLLQQQASCAPHVTAGHQYDLSVYFHATTPNVALTAFKHTASGWAYWTDLATLSAAPAWTQALGRTPAVPTGVDQISFGISIYGNGSVFTDDYSATDATPPPPPTSCTGTTAQCTQGQWTVAAYPNAVRSVHSILLSNGKVLMMAGSGNNPMAFAAGSFKSTLWDPATGAFSDVPTPADLFCSGHVQLPNGSVLIVGGNKAYPAADGSHGYEGLNSSYIFDITTGGYRPVNNLNTGHWYPSATELGNGNVLSLGGLNETSGGTVETELFSNATQAWQPHNSVPQTYSYWGLYPSMVLMQDGRLFYSGSHVFGNQGPSGSGADIYDFTAAKITDVPGLQDPQERDQSSAVLLPPAQNQQVMIFGGGNVNTNVDANRYTDLINLLAPNPSYAPGPLLPQGTTEPGNSANMQMTDATVKPETAAQGKMYVSTVLLPDGKVLETGGALHNRADPVYEASTYDPVTNSFSPAAVDPVERLYHSESYLLPDGRVVSVGSNPGDGSFDMRMSIYSPPYLFQADKPSITGLGSTEWSYGSTQMVATSEAVTAAELIRPAAVTHSSDPNQRLVDLPLTVSGGSVSLNVTSNPNLAPPGWYMLFVKNSAGTPSTAKWVHLS